MIKNIILTRENELQILSSILPSGKYWENKNNLNTTIGKYLYSISKQYNEFRYFFNEKKKELIVSSVDEYIEKWEKLVGLPDLIFNVIPNSKNERLRNILIKYIGLQARTKAEVIHLLKQIFPQIIDITIQDGLESITYPALYPVRFFSVMEAQQYIIVTITGLNEENKDKLFPLPFPLPFTTDIKTFVEKLLKYIAPFDKKIIVELL